jgi:hypothetical protein
MNDVYKRTWVILHTDQEYAETSQSIMSRSSHVCTADAAACKAWDPVDSDIKCFKNLVSG